MYSIQEYLEPVRRQYNRFLDGAILSDLLQFKGQRGVGNGYISKVFRSKSMEIYSEYQHVSKSVHSPTYSGFMIDNIFRLVCLNAVQRLIVAYQAAPGLLRQGRPQSMSFLFTEIMNDGAFRGTLRGLSLSAAQTSLVLWPSVLLTNSNESGYQGFLSTYLILDTLLHPLDTIKNFMYSRTIKPSGLSNALGSITINGLYRGVFSKFFFNIPYATALYSTTQHDENAWAYWLATGLFYPLLVKKVALQTKETINLSGSSYRGVIPFLALNYLFCWKLLPLFSAQKQAQVLANAQSRQIRELGEF